jgi:hypothetical protein
MFFIGSLRGLARSAAVVATALLVEIPVGALVIGAACLTGLLLLQSSAKAQQYSQDEQASAATDDQTAVVEDTKSPDPSGSQQSPKDFDPAVDPSQVKYIGNKDTRKFHTVYCWYGEIMWHRRRRIFAHRADAIDAGYLPCRYCLPKYWTSVRAQLLAPAECESAHSPPVDSPPPTNNPAPSKTDGSPRAAPSDKRIESNEPDIFDPFLDPQFLHSAAENNIVVVITPIRKQLPATASPGGKTKRQSAR